MSEINLAGVAVAALLSFIVGALWYSPVLFLKPWSAAAGVDPSKDMDNMPVVMAATAVFTLASAAALAILLGPAPEMADAVVCAVLVSLCVVAASLGINYQFASRHFAHWAIDSGFHFVRFIVMALVLSLMG